MRVELCRRNVGMAQHLLDRSQVAAAGKQMRRERMPERVRAHLPLEARGLRVALDDLVKALPSQGPAPEVDEEPALRRAVYERRPRRTQISRDRRGRCAPERHYALLRALAVRSHEAPLQVDIRQLEPNRLGRAQPASV